MKRLEASKHKVFTSFLLSYVLILLIPLLVGSLGLTEAERIVRTYATETCLSILEQTRDVLDARTTELKKMATVLALSPRVRSLLGAEAPIAGRTYYTIWEMNRDLQTYQLTETFLATFFVYFGNIDMIVSPTTACPVSSYYGYSLQYGDLSEKDWKELMLGRHYSGEFAPSAAIRYEGNGYSVLPYLQSLPMGRYDERHAVIVMLVDEARVKRLLETVKMYDHGWVYVADSQGRVITSVAGARARPQTIRILPREYAAQTRIGGQLMTVVHTTSSANGWHYVAVLPSRAVMGQVRYIVYLTYGLALVSLLLGLLAAYYLANRNVKPLKEIVRSLTGLFEGRLEERDATEYDVLRGSLSAIGSIITDNKSLRYAVEKQRPLLKAAIIERLLKGGFRQVAEIESAFAYVGWEVHGRGFAVLVTRITGYEGQAGGEYLEALGYVRAMIEDNLASVALAEAHLQSVDQSRFAAILVADTDDQQAFVRRLEPVIRQTADLLLNRYEVRAYFSLGNATGDLLGICNSYDQARQASDYQAMKEDKDILWYGDLPKESVRYFYPIETEEQLIYLTRIGKRREVKELLERIYQENFEQRLLSVDMAQQLLYEIRGTVNKVMDERISEETREQYRYLLRDGDNIDNFFANVTKVLTSVCALIADRGKKSNAVANIASYVRLNYKDVNLSLTAVASRFGLAPAHLSQLFKEETGEYFSAYLERVRLDRACELLAEPDLSVNEIAGQLGYNSDKAFRRAFKRVKGVSPVHFRRMLVH